MAVQCALSSLFCSVLVLPTHTHHFSSKARAKQQDRPGSELYVCRQGSRYMPTFHHPSLPPTDCPPSHPILFISCLSHPAFTPPHSHPSLIILPFVSFCPFCPLIPFDSIANYRNSPWEPALTRTRTSQNCFVADSSVTDCVLILARPPKDQNHYCPAVTRQHFHSFRLIPNYQQRCH